MSDSSFRPTFAQEGYVLRSEEALAIRALLSHRGSGAAAALLEGPPGVGKTDLGQVLAKIKNWPCIYGQLHAWSDADELFSGIDVASAVAGQADSVRQDGILAVAAKASLENEKVVLILDEIDKTHERCEALLLDFLQTGRVPVKPGVHLQADLSRLVIFVTSNGQRELSDAFLRRVRRTEMRSLPIETINQLVQKASGAPKGVVTLTTKSCRRIAEVQKAALSLQEMAHATREAWELAASHAEVQEILCAWAVRNQDGRKAVKSAGSEAIWGEISKCRSIFL